ncbi:MAG: acetate--CoA ligase family protein [Pseudomonadota bacterium]
MVARRFERLLAPRRIAVVGGGAWCEAIAGAAARLGFSGEIVPVHPTRAEIAGRPTVPSVEEIAGSVDAAFVGVNREASVEVIAALRETGAGGAVCFASGFSEAKAEVAGGASLEARLHEAAGDMPVLGPNCYGYLNALDGAGLWPDQHGLTPIDKGVAILTQSSNIAINLTMQSRGLPIAVVITCGNQTLVSQAELASAMLEDPRITAIGLHIEGFGDLRAWEALAARASERGVALIALKSGRSAEAQSAALSHTASLAGGDAGAEAFLQRLGIARVQSLPGFLEALKIGHLHGRLPGRSIASISCSGGEAALAADAAEGSPVHFPPLNKRQRDGLRAALGPKVSLANPLDYHTYIWRDEAAMTRAWAAVADPGIDLTLIVLDYPRADLCDAADWEIATRAAIAAQKETGTRYAVCATLPELLPEATSRELLAAGLLPLHGLDTAIEAIAAMGAPMPAASAPVLLPGGDRSAEMMTEADAKAALAAHGLTVPAGVETTRADAREAARHLDAPFAVKVLGLAHKTGAGGVALGVTPETLDGAIAGLADGPLLIEEMVRGAVAELLIGVTRDPAHGFLLTLGAGGTMAEILDDTVHMLVPASREEIGSALTRLKMAPRLNGYRGAAPADLPAILDAVEAVQAYVMDNAATLEEVEINPLTCTPDAAIAADALIRKAPT